MIPGISGSLLSHDALENAIRNRLQPVLDEAGSHRARARLRTWYSQVLTQLGPTATARMVFDRVAVPLLSQLNYRVQPGTGTFHVFGAALESKGTRIAGLLVTAWGRDPGTAWRESVQQGIGLDVPWCFCLTGTSLRIVDTRRTYSRRFLQFELERTLENSRAFQMLWGLLRAEAMAAGADRVSALDNAIVLSEEHRTIVRNSLQQGVQDALLHLHKAFGLADRWRGAARPRQSPEGHLPETLIVIYRILFLLFAEARGLVPRWHPTYRDSYTIEALREPVELLPRPRGLWETLQAISRLAHRGCRVGSLHVPPFNGHLFSPVDAPLSDAVPLDDATVRQALLALTTRPARSGRVRVAYGDLGVEQLGGIYERLLDFKLEPGGFAPPDPPSPSLAGAPAPRSAPALIPSEVRKSSGSFYTPRALTEFLVRRTLAPLVQNAAPDEILALRIVDPAMGSGAFLVAACRYLASAYEGALIREGPFLAADITDAERVSFRRAVAQRCLFGVDVNPMAVQLGRLSLWLATLAADRPLTLLDHRLRVGNSLVGARIEDLRRQPPAPGRSSNTILPLFDDERAGVAMRAAVEARLPLCTVPDDTLEQVRAKEHALASLAQDPSIARWNAVADLWCAQWFRSSEVRKNSRATFGALADTLLGRQEVLPPHVAAPLLDDARRTAARHRFFHWTLEFPEIFHDASGARLASGGFDAVIGNPPWEMLRGDGGSAADRRRSRDDAAMIVSFARSSGIYRLQGPGHINLYQLFLERALSLARPGGRFGMIVPSGLALDQGSADLRRALLDRTTLDGLISFDNRDGVFPIHRSLKFLLLAGTTGGASAELACRFGVRNPAELEAYPDSGFGPDAITLTRPLVDRLSGPALVIPELKTRTDVEIVADLTFRVPALADPEGWGVRFGRELNATDDRKHFSPAASRTRGLPVVEGKHVSPFVLDLDSTVFRISQSQASALLDASRTFGRSRLAYRDIAGATNRVSLIAAMIPPGVVTTHTLFCLKDDLEVEAQHFLCAMFNSFVSNYLVRSRIGTHVGASVIARLGVPQPPRSYPLFREAVALARALARGHDAGRAARLQGIAAYLYGLRREQFQHILGTFPLVPERDRRDAMRAFCDIVLSSPPCPTTGSR